MQTERADPEADPFRFWNPRGVRALGEHILAAGEPALQREFRIFALQRSGQHAFVNWLCAQLNATGVSTCHFNDAMDDRLLTRQFGTVEADVVVANAEDAPIEAARARFEELEARTFLGDRPVSNIILLRDPWNLFASRHKYRWSCRLGNTSRQAVECWRDHATQFSESLSWSSLWEFRPVNFNHWFRLRPYREFLADSMGVRFTDAGIDDVVHHGGGSSFDGTKFDGRAQDMGVLERWRQVSPRLYRAIFDETLTALAESIFGTVVQEREMAG